MPPKGVSKAVSKRCPECKKQLPVATRHCACGHQFFEERRRSTTTVTPPLDSGPDIEEISPLNSSVCSNGSNATVLQQQQQLQIQLQLQQQLLESRVASGGCGVIADGMLGTGGMSGGGGGKGGGGAVGGGGIGGGNQGVASVEGGKRRSERVKREKPNFYDALEYDNQMRKARRERQKDEPQPHTTASGRAKRERRPKNSSPDEEDEEEPVVKDKKRRKKKKKAKKEEDEEDEDIMAGLTPQMEMSFAVVLSDINFKLGLNNPRFT